MSLLEEEIKKSGVFKNKETKVQPTAISKDNITVNFSWKEALFLPSWNRIANPSDGLTEEIKGNLIKVFLVLEDIRLLYNKPITIHCAYRPLAYNIQIGGATHSAHIEGKAIDFSISNVTCNNVRTKLMPMLDKLNIRMENLPNSNWVHIDIRNTSPRYFKP